MHVVRIEKIRAQIEVILHHWGMSEADINTTSIAMSYADLSGIDSHGISMLMKYEALVSDGRLDMRAQPEIVTETPAIAVLNAHSGLGHPVAVKAMDLAIDKASVLGIGAVAVFNSNHFGAAGYYVRRAASEGLIGVITTTAASLAVIPTGGRYPMLGTNPLAFAAPSEGGEPFVLDMSTSTVAMNKVKMYALRKDELPEGWVTDETGKSVTDSTVAYDYLRRRREGGLAPLGGPTTRTGGHKGYGLSMMVQILSAALSNAALPGMTQEQDANIGHFVLALDPEVFNPGGRALDYTSDLIRLMHTSLPVDGEQPVLVAGEPEARCREKRMQRGVPLPDLLIESIQSVCERNGVPFILQAG